MTDATSIVVRNVAVSTTSSDRVTISGSGPVLLTQVLLTGTSSAGVRTAANTTVNCTSCSINSTSGVGVQSIGSSTTLGNTAVVTTTATDVLLASSGGILTVNASQLTGTSDFVIQNGATGSIGNSRCNCLSNANSGCLVAGTEGTGLSAGVVGRTSSLRMTAGVDVTNCTYGMLSAGFAEIQGSSTSALSGNALTYGGNAVSGGSIHVFTGTFTITGATAEMSVDTGLGVGTWASLAASFDCLGNPATGSRICRQ